MLRGWRRYKNHPNPRIRARFAYEAANLPVKYAGALWAARRRCQDDPHSVQLISQVLDELYAEFGWKARLAAPIVGRYFYHMLRREEQRLQNGWTYEPPTLLRNELGRRAGSGRASHGRNGRGRVPGPHRRPHRWSDSGRRREGYAFSALGSCIIPAFSPGTCAGRIVARAGHNSWHKYRG